jgi:hypothetical protein
MLTLSSRMADECYPIPGSNSTKLRNPQNQLLKLHCEQFDQISA